MSDVRGNLLAMIEAEDGVSAARVCKQLGLARSELKRVLTALGPELGLDLVRVERADGRDLLHLTERARAARQAK